MQISLTRAMLVCGLAVAAVNGPALAEIPPEEEEISVADSGWTFALRRGFGRYLDLIVKGQASDGERVLGRYAMEDCDYCEGLEDNCDQTGIRAHILSSRFNPVVVTVCNVGDHSQQIRLYDPVIDPAQPVFERTGTYFLQYVAGESELVINYDREEELSDGEGKFLYSVLNENWPENPFSLLNEVGFEPFARTEIEVPAENLLTAADQRFLKQLQDIVDSRDLISLRDMLADDVVVPHSEQAGVEAFFDYWGLNRNSEDSWLWPVLARLLDAGGVRTQTETGTSITLPFYQRFFPSDLSALSHGLVIGFKVPLRATPSLSSVALARISHEPALVLGEVVGMGGGSDRWLRIVLGDGTIGYLQARHFAFSGGAIAIFENGGQGWYLKNFMLEWEGAGPGQSEDDLEATSG